MGDNEYDRDVEKAAEYFKKSLEKGGEEAKWFVDVMEGVDGWDDKEKMKEAFARTEDRRGWYVAAMFIGDRNSRERFDLVKKSSDAGYSYGQVDVAEYYRGETELVETNMEERFKLLKKAADQNNPKGMHWLGDCYEDGNGVEKDFEKARQLYKKAALISWSAASYWLGGMYYAGKGVERDLKQVLYWSGSGIQYGGEYFTWAFDEIQEEAEKESFDGLDLVYMVGKMLYWYVYDTEKWEEMVEHEGVDGEFGLRCLDFYCDNIDRCREEVFTFLMCLKKCGVIRDAGVVAGKMLWEMREEGLKGWEKKKKKGQRKRRKK